MLLLALLPSAAAQPGQVVLADLGLGVGGQYHAVTIGGNPGAPGFVGFYPQLDASLGYAF